MHMCYINSKHEDDTTFNNNIHVNVQLSTFRQSK